MIVSAGSCTTNSMAAMVKLLDENWGIKAGFMTTIHAYTGTQMILDGPRFPRLATTVPPQSTPFLTPPALPRLSARSFRP